MMSVKRPHPLHAGPRPPFKNQTGDPGSGSTDALEPKPDHGETSYRGTGRLKGSKALVVGGDSGIGRAISIAFAREGADVGFTYHSNEKDARTTADLLSEEPDIKNRPYQLDQGNERQCQAVLDAFIEEFGQLDILVNNAARQDTYPEAEAIDSEAFESTFRTNAFGVFYLCQAALKRMPEGACIINSSSIQAFSPSAQLLPYAATKAAIANMTKSFATFAIDKGIRVNAVAPGPVWTPLIPATMPPEKVEQFGANTLPGRPAQPVELAGAYVYLASADASYLTGETIPVTGGRRQL